MRKSFYLSLLCLFVLAGTLNAQICQPDTSITHPGIYPDSATGLPSATENQFWEQDITVIVPVDTIIDIGSGPMLALIDSVKLVNLRNLPAWATIECDPPTCAFPGGETHCAKISGTPPIGAADTSVIDIIVRYFVKLQGFPFAQNDTTYSYYTLITQVATGLTLDAGNSILVGSLRPNPARSFCLLPILVNHSSTALLTVTDLLGRQVFSKSIALTSGRNNVIIPLDDLNKGYYFVNLNYEGKSNIKRLMVR